MSRLGDCPLCPSTAQGSNLGVQLCRTLNINGGVVTAAGVVAAACFRRPEQEDSKSNSSRAGPFAGPKPEPMTVPRGATRSNWRTHPSRLGWARGFLPSWSCEFDSRHPLNIITPSQSTFECAKLFEQTDDKNDKAGRASSMIMGARSTELPCQGLLFGSPIRLRCS
jgi:hypothetical protein